MNITNDHLKNILILAPHLDDGELGCGATIAKFTEQNINIYYVGFSTCEESIPNNFPKNILENEVKEATSVLNINPQNIFIKHYPVRKFPQYRQDILEDLIKLKRHINPDLIFMPSSFDIHQDHNTIYSEGVRAFKNHSILGYEFMWNNFSFNTTCFITVQEKHIESKIRAIDKYKSQQDRFYSKDKFIKGLANYRGLQISEEYAEAFEIIRWIVR